MPFTIGLTEYKMLHPDTAEVPTLSQNGMLAVLLQKRRCKLTCLTHRQAKCQARRQALRAWFGRWLTKLSWGTASSQVNPVLADAVARNL